MNHLKTFENWTNTKAGEKLDILNKTYRPFISSNPEYFVTVIDVDYDKDIVTYKFKDGEIGNLDLKEFLGAYIEI